MKMPISELIERSFPESVELEAADPQLASRIKETVMKKIRENEEPTARRSVRRGMRLLPLAALLAGLLTVAVLAVSFARMHVRPVEGAQGQVTTEAGESHTLDMQEARLELSFEAGGDCFETAVKPGWLPQEPSWSETDGEGFGSYFLGDGEDPTATELPYLINVYPLCHLEGIRWCFNGEAAVLREDSWRGWKRTEIHVDYSGSGLLSWGAANYILLLSEEDGYLLYIGGTSDMETLEKIAENLEVRVSETPVPPRDNSGTDISYFDLARG